MIETPKEILAHHASTGAVDGFLDWRKIIKKPLTERAALLIAKTLREITSQGGDADEALDLAQEHGWRTIKTAWYWMQKNGQRNHNMAGRGHSSANTSAQQIAFAATARRTPSADSF